MSAALVVLVSLLAPAVHAETARTILDRLDRLDRTERHWEDRTQRLKFRIIDRRGGTRSRELDLAEKRYPNDERKSILFVSSPPEVKGTSFLAFTHKGRPADQWIFLPAYRKTRQITANTRNQSFIGTDLTYHDLDILSEMTSWTERDAASHLRGDEVVDTVTCHVIELTPNREDIGYKTIVVWLGRNDLVPRRIELFGNEAEPAKRILQSDIRAVGTIPIAHNTRVETPHAGTSTEIVVVGAQFNQKLTDDTFSKRALEQGPQ